MHHASRSAGSFAAEISNVLGDEQLSRGLDEVGSVAVGSILDKIIAPLTEKLQTVVKLETMTENFFDLEILDGGGERDPRASLNIGRISGIKLDLIRVEIRMRFRLAEIELVRGAGLVMPENFVRADESG